MRNQISESAFCVLGADTLCVIFARVKPCMLFPIYLACRQLGAIRPAVPCVSAAFFILRYLPPLSSPYDSMVALRHSSLCTIPWWHGGSRVLARAVPHLQSFDTTDTPPHTWLRINSGYNRQQTRDATFRFTVGELVHVCAPFADNCHDHNRSF